jgi:undecaprenyl-phosphate 4-deoxy-4-formamido-L-arabinose transferase
VYNEADNLPELFQRLTDTLQSLGRPYEVVFVDDGSRDASLQMLLDLRGSGGSPSQAGPIVVVELARNFGQHLAVLAGLERARGEIVVTLDADLQNPPEEIPSLLACIERGHDVVGGYRVERHDSWFRRGASRLANRLRERTTALRMRDHGCMLRAYRREIVELILQSAETVPFIPALATLYASRPAELAVAHAPRASGQSKYGLYRLIRLHFDLWTGFSAAPLQLFTVIGGLVSLFSAGMVAVLAVRRVVVGPEVEGVFTLLGVLFFLIGVAITGIGIMGEYVARIYEEVRRRPRYVVRKVHGGDGDD